MLTLYGFLHLEEICKILTTNDYFKTHIAVCVKDGINYDYTHRPENMKIEQFFYKNIVAF